MSNMTFSKVTIFHQHLDQTAKSPPYCYRRSIHRSLSWYTRDRDPKNRLAYSKFVYKIQHCQLHRCEIAHKMTANMLRKPTEQVWFVDWLCVSRLDHPDIRSQRARASFSPAKRWQSRSSLLEQRTISKGSLFRSQSIQMYFNCILHLVLKRSQIYKRNFVLYESLN